MSAKKISIYHLLLIDSRDVDKKTFMNRIRLDVFRDYYDLIAIDYRKQCTIDEQIVILKFMYLSNDLEVFRAL